MSAQKQTEIMGLFATLAEYNRVTNQELLAILAGLPGEMLTRELGGFFGSIIGTANHILMADISWLRRFSSSVPQLEGLKDELPPVQAAAISDTPWPDFGDYRAVREAVDGLLARAAATIPAAALSNTMTYTDSKGRRQEKIIRIALLHVFNHQTHHRGQIALMLDMLEIENDYSNLVWKF